jgi:hypothetical protein
MQLILMIWNGISGLGPGTVALKALFMLVLAALFWMVCELVKYLFNVCARFAVDALRYLAIVVRGWPKESENPEEKREPSRWNRPGH